MTAGLDSTREGLAIDPARLNERLDALAHVGAIPGTMGCSRLALSDADREGRDLVVGWMRDLDLDIVVDGVGNVTATMPAPRGAPVLTGSHIDTVATGGRYDGNLGVLTGLEVIETVLSAGLELRRPLGVAFFTDEEGARFAPDMLGSLVYVGGLALEEALDIRGIDGPTVGAELERIGYRGPAPCPGPAPFAFLELHIEQGPVLEAEGHRLGAVTGVQGISWTEVRIVGESNHAGTTPMAMRKDPAVAAGAITTFVHDLAVEFGPPQVGTVGKLDLHPDLVNVVPASATLTVDLRNTDEAILAEAEARLAEFLEAVSDRFGVSVETSSLARFAPVEFDPRIVDLVSEVALEQGEPAHRMPSGAGHDAQMLARVCPTGMVFVPSNRGISHNPAEHTESADLELGANVLLHSMIRLAGEP
ncbi:MAG: Zn-dependent hydrolase [Actinomycetia bacterium]|nr:Zn-dependent hydrolase [Actinomycetes bacterium]